MTPIQQLMLGAGSVSEKTYLDDLFSTFLYDGTGSAKTITNGIDLSGEGGMTWIKSRTSDYNHALYDTVRGNTGHLYSNQSWPSHSVTTGITSFNNNGFSIGTHTDLNNSSQDFSSWSFRKAPGFFDVVTYTGNGSAAHQISHNLGSVPGCIMVKCTSESQDWMVYHVHTTDPAGPGGAYLKLNSTAAEYGSSDAFQNATATSSIFTLGDGDIGNKNNATYVAYLFAGGESTAATARSVDFDGSGDYLSVADSSDFEIDGTNFTLECWFKADDLSGGQAIAGQWESGGGTDRNFDFYLNGSTLLFENCRGSNNYSVTTTVEVGQWYHIAGVLDGTTLKLFVNGNLVGTTTVSGSANNSTANFGIGGYATGTAEEFNGKISNVRFVKGTAVYTSSFRPPTEPLTNITNTKLLCCNDSSTTGSTVTPGTITANGDPIARTYSPFDDPAGFVFGHSGKENVIKCGSYVGKGTNLQDVFLGFEPQWVMIKCLSNSTIHTNWAIYDSMRGVVSGGNDRQLVANEPNGEESGDNYATSDLIEFTSTGFKVGQSGWDVNHSTNETYIYVAIRRSDGYVGKPYGAGEGTSVFAMDTGDNSSTIPNFDSGFPVDFAAYRQPASSSSWYNSSRLTAGKEMKFDDNTAESSFTPLVFDSNTGWQNHNSHGSSFQSWMWKRHAGFDVVTYTGDSTNPRSIFHSLSKEPEMIWLKRRGASENWLVGVNFGSSNYDILKVNNNDAAINLSYNARFMSKPTSTAFTIDQDSSVNGSGETYLAMLFASVSGISKVGYYTGNGTGQTITTGFQPRFLIIKKTNQVEHWWVLDTTRGWGSGNDKYLKLDTDATQADHDFGAPTSTGFTLVDGNSAYNANTETYIYYAHA